MSSRREEMFLDGRLRELLVRGFYLFGFFAWFFRMLVVFRGSNWEVVVFCYLCFVVWFSLGWGFFGDIVLRFCLVSLSSLIGNFLKL